MARVESGSIPKFYVPVGKIDEMPPAFMVRSVEREMNKGSPFRALRLADEVHVRLVRQAVALSRVAGDAGADNVFPCRKPSLLARNNMVKVQILAVKYTAAILAGVLVPLEDIMPGELDLLLGQLVEHQQHDDARDPDPEGDGVNHLGLGLPQGKIMPA